MDDIGSCVNYYRLGEPVEELQGVTMLLDGRIDDFIGHCSACSVFIDFGAEIVDGAVHRVWPLRWETPRATLVSPPPV